MNAITHNSKIEKIVKPIMDHAKVNAVFGEAQRLGQKIVIPVGQVLLIGGGGLGFGPNEYNHQDEGGGGGLILSAKPIGTLEVTEETTRFVRINSWKNKIFPFSLGVLFGVIVLKWLTSKK